MIYSAFFEEIAVSAAQDLFELLCPTDAVIRVIGAGFGQSSDAGDAQAEMAAIAIMAYAGGPSVSRHTRPSASSSASRTG